VRVGDIKHKIQFISFVAGFAFAVSAFVFIQIIIFQYTGSAHAADAEPSIVVNPASNAVEIVVSGREIARFDANGLHVRSGIEYGGTLTDTGEAQYAGDRAQ